MPPIELISFAVAFTGHNNKNKLNKTELNFDTSILFISHKRVHKEEEACFVI
jgi:hypothetical protein